MPTSFKFAIRTLLKDLGFFVPAILLLAFGIGANTAMFSVVSGVLLHPLPYRDSDRIVTVWSYFENLGRRGTVSALDFHDWRSQNNVLEAFAMYRAAVTNVVLGSRPERAGSARVSAEFFDVMSVKPVRGRVFTAGEDRPGGPPLAVISYGLWQRSLGGSEDAIGQTVKLSDRVFTVVGILPRGFRFPEDSDVWVAVEPLHFAAETRDAHNYQAIGRLRAGISLEQANSQLASIGHRLARQYPEDATTSVVAVPLLDQTVGNVRLTLMLLFASVIIVLLIACANVVNLLLAKAVKREPEIAIRIALGATRGRLVRQLLSEALVLVVPAGLLGLLIGYGGLRAFTLLAPQGLPRLQEVALDRGVVLFTAAVSVLTSIAFGLAPALNRRFDNLADALKAGGTRSVSTVGHARVRSALVVSELALSVGLLIVAALLGRSWLALHDVDPGYRTDRILVASSTVAPSLRPGDRKGPYFYEVLLDQLRALPGVLDVAGVSSLPGTRARNGRYQIEGHPAVQLGDFVKQQAAFTVVTPNYFRTLGIGLHDGRDFDDSDRADRPLTCIINQAVAQESFHGQNPLGQRVRTGMDGSGWMTVVGVVGDVRQYGIDRVPPPQIYMPYLQHPGVATNMQVLVRSQGEANALQDSLRRRGQSIDPDIPLAFTTLDRTVAESLATPRFRAVLVGMFAALAMALALLGLYAVLSYMVNHRSREIAVRMALGAQPRDVLKLVFRQGLGMILPGISLGLLAALAASSAVKHLVYGIGATDLATFSSVPLLLMMVALLALYRPARRAARLDPALVLRRE
jgi:predicted permease